MPVLNFKGKTAVENFHHAVPHYVLEFDPALSELPKGRKPSLDGNLIIEGDNLLALKALLPTHAGKVKCIYIDPPYNTGNEGWIYNDNLTQPQFKEWIGRVVGKEGEDACRHDKWCCMMYPRLRVLRDLLREDGVIFVSVDDIECARLKLMLDEVFGEDAFVANLIWKARQFPDARATTGVSTDHEYILVYGRGGDTRLRGGERDKSKYSNPDGDPRGDWMSRSILGLADASARPNLHYPITEPGSGREFHPPPDTGWRYQRSKMREKVADGRILFPARASGRPREKVFLEELETAFPGFPSIIDDVYTAHGTAEVGRILGNGAFPFPKPSALIRLLLAQATSGGDLVLDSFAGSGTTAHAVLALNAEDEGGRRFILVQMARENEADSAEDRNVCASIAAERVRRVISGYADRKSGTQVPPMGGSFTYARLGPPLLGDHRNWGETLPSYEDLAKYVFFTDTGTHLDPKRMKPKSGKIGEHAETSYYLLYDPGAKEGAALDQRVLDTLAKDKNPRKVVYCEKVWVHREDLLSMRSEIGEVRTMQLPFQVRGS